MTPIAALRNIEPMLRFLFRPTYQQRWLGRAMFVIAVIATSYLVFSRPVSMAVSVPHMDKISHFSAFFALAALLQLASGIKRRWQMLFLVVYAALIEVVQYHLPYRSAEWLDLAADIGGALLFYLLLLVVQQWPKPLR